MSLHVVLLFEPDRAAEDTEPSIVRELALAGWEVVRAHDLNMVAAMLYVNRSVEAVVIGAADDRITAKLVESTNAIRPGLPIFTLSTDHGSGTRPWACRLRSQHAGTPLGSRAWSTCCVRDRLEDGQ